jgi:uncharacterized protein YndB with AHSA1/START domain
MSTCNASNINNRRKRTTTDNIDSDTTIAATELVIDKVFDAPPDLVYRAFMVSDDNPDWQSPVDGYFTEVVENELLVGTEEFLACPDSNHRRR